VTRTPTRHPTRRHLLRALSLTILGVPLVSLGKMIDRQGRRRRRYVRPPTATSDIWIGHC